LIFLYIKFKSRVTSDKTRVSELKEWQALTPETLRPAVEHIRKAFGTDVWKCRQLTEVLAFAALHPEDAVRSDFSDYHSQLPVYLQIVGSAAEKEYKKFLAVGTPPAVFRAYLNVLRRGIESAIAKRFNDLLQIGLTNAASLSSGPVQWAQSHLQLLIHDCSHTLNIWIKEVCDGQNRPTAFGTNEELDEMSFWKSWRAPKLIHMKPSGNSPYNPTNAWSREDEARTSQLLEALSRDLLLSLDIFLEKISGEAHVRHAQFANATSALSVPEEQRPGPYVSKAPNPVSPVGRRRSSWSTTPEPARTLIEFPPEFPAALIPRATLIIDDAIKAFPKQTEILSLCRKVLADIAPRLTLLAKPPELLSQAGNLVHYLLVANCADSDRRFHLDQEIRKSEEWINLSRMAADAMESTKKQVADTATWEDIEITFLTEFTFQASRAGRLEEAVHYSVLGFIDGRNETPNKAWHVLIELAEKGGKIPPGGRTRSEFDKLGKRIQEIRSLLKQHFRLADDPISYLHYEGYRTRFKIKRGPWYDQP
jgi:hypothetical protein